MNIGTIIGLLIAVGTAIKDNLPDDEKEINNQLTWWVYFIQKH